MYINTDEEIWKDIDGYEGIYQVSNLGRVKSFHGRNEKIMKQRFHRGYKIINLTKNKKVKTFRVGRLVAIAFIPNPERKPEVNHIDEVKSNDRVDNLSWVTSKENSNHGSLRARMSENGKKQYESGNLANFISSGAPKGNANAARPIYMKDVATGEVIRRFPSMREAFRYLGKKPTGNITSACLGKLDKAYGYKWEYED